MAHHVIYIPGLGDHHTYGQNIAIQLWRFFGLRPHYLALGWSVGEGYDTKQRRLIELVNTLHTNGNTVSLVGVSAGASACLNTFASSDKIHRLICISGKINNPDTIARRRFEINPDFKESMSRVSKSLESLGPLKTADIISIHPRKDPTVPVSDTIIKGAKDLTVPGKSHPTGIFFGIIFGSLSIARFIRTNGR